MIHKHVDQYLDKHVEISSTSIEDIENSIKEDQQTSNTSQIQTPQPLKFGTKKNTNQEITDNNNNTTTTNGTPSTPTTPTTTNNTKKPPPPLPSGNEWKKLILFHNLQEERNQINKNINKFEK